MPPVIDLTGQTFGRWKVKQRDWAARPDERARWICRCECGEKRSVDGGNLRTGLSRSCGCLHSEQSAEAHRTHGMSGTKVYQAWQGMHTRCGNPREPGFKHYGGRGIKICKRWRKFENFYADMGIPPSKKHSLDRIDNDGNYEPRNCRWATELQQKSNRRNTRRLTFKGETKTITEWSRKTGLSWEVIYGRVRLGWSVHKALSTPKL